MLLLYYSTPIWSSPPNAVGIPISSVKGVEIRESEGERERERKKSCTHVRDPRISTNKKKHNKKKFSLWLLVDMQNSFESHTAGSKESRWYLNVFDRKFYSFSPPNNSSPDEILAI